jgi:hypothetical protein
MSDEFNAEEEEALRADMLGDLVEQTITDHAEDLGIHVAAMLVLMTNGRTQLRTPFELKEVIKHLRVVITQLEAGLYTKSGNGGTDIVDN